MTITTTHKKTKYNSTLGNKMLIYFDCNLADVLDKEVFYPYVMDLKVKSKAWPNLFNKMIKKLIAPLNELLKGNYKIKYSRKAGCKCGCSPAIVVERGYDLKNPYLEFNESWMSFEFSEEEIQDFRSLHFTKTFKALAKEAALPAA